MEGESEAIRDLDWRIRITQAALEEARRTRDFWQQQMDALANTRRDLWRARYEQRKREANAASMDDTNGLVKGRS